MNSSETTPATLMDNFIVALRSSEENIMKQLPLTSPTFIWLLTGAYLLFVLKLGPAYMKSRQPFKLKRLMAFYNLTQVAINATFVLIGIYIFTFTHLYDLGCVTPLPLHSPLKYVELYICYVFYIVRLLDLLDTVFYVLRKNYRQVTFLHVVHHMMVALLGNMYVNLYGSGGHIVSYGFLNAFVHAIMYTYYYISAEIPDWPHILKLKTNITRMQLLQFVLIFMHGTYPILYRPDCTYPILWLRLLQAESIFFIVMFGKFYVNTYLRAKSAKANVIKVD